MKPTTRIKIGFNHIGASAEAPEIFDGSLHESLAWLISKLSAVTLARRIQISIARTDEEVMVGLTAQRQRKSDAKLAGAMNLLDLLGDMGDDSEDEEHEDSPGREVSDPLDDYQVSRES